MKRLFCFLTVLFMIQVQNSFAQQNNDAIDLSPILVTPYRFSEALNKTAASVTVITQKDIKNSNANKVIDVLRPIPGVTVRDVYGNGTKATVDIAGFGEQAPLNVLVLVDGRRINDVDLSGVDWSQIPLDRVDHIEVLRGASGGVLYGDNAVSGVINIITKKGSGKPKVNYESIYGSYDMNKEQLSLSGTKDDNLSYWLSGARGSTHGYRQNSFDKGDDFASKFEYAMSDKLSAHFASGFHANSYGIPGALYQDNIDQFGRRYARFPQDHANNKDFYFVFGPEVKLAGLGTLDLDYSYRQKDTDTYFLSSGNPTRRNKIETFGFTPKYTLGDSILDHDNKFIAGLDYYRSFYNSDSISTSPTWLDDNVSAIDQTSLAGYLQDEFNLADQLALTGGYRYETARYGLNYHDENLTAPIFTNPTQVEKSLYRMQAFDTGLVYTYKADSNFFLNVGKSFRFPEVDEFSYLDENYNTLMNPNLKPQSGIDYQVGVRHKLNDQIRTSFTLYRMNVKDELYFDSTGGSTGSGQNGNYDKTVHEGLESSLEVKLNDWISSIESYTFTNAFFNGGPYDKNEIPAVARQKGSLGLRFLLPQNFTLNATETYVGPRYFLNDQANAYSRLNGYMLTDLNLSWRHKDLTMTFGINNLLNKEYSEFGGVRVTEDFVYGYHTGDKFYFPSPTRNFSVKMEYVF